MKIDQDMVQRANEASAAIKTALQNLNSAIKDAAEKGVACKIETLEHTSFRVSFTQLRAELSININI